MTRKAGAVARSPRQGLQQALYPNTKVNNGILIAAQAESKRPLDGCFNKDAQMRKIVAGSVSAALLAITLSACGSTGSETTTTTVSTTAVDGEVTSQTVTQESSSVAADGTVTSSTTSQTTTPQ